MKKSHGPSTFLLVVVSVIMGLLILEGGLRLFLPLLSQQPDPLQAEFHLYDPYRGHRLNPDFNTLNNTFGKKINSPDGFRRDTIVNKIKDKKTIRIVVFGGSTLYGVGTWGGQYPNHAYLMNDETITHFLEELLNAQLKENNRLYTVEVLNAGVVAYHTFQHLVHLNAKLLDYRPDIVVNLDGHNDFYISNPEYNNWTDYGYSGSPLINLINERSFLVGLHLLVRNLSKYSAIMSQVEKRVTNKIFDDLILKSIKASEAQPDGDFDSNFMRAARKGFMRALWQIHRLGQYEGYEHLVFLQPEVVFEQDAFLSEEDRAIKQVTIDTYSPGQVKKMDAIRSMLPGIFLEQAIPYEDIGEIGSPKTSGEQLYIDYCHLTSRGSQVVAQRMAPAVYERVLVSAIKHGLE